MSEMRSMLDMFMNQNEQEMEFMPIVPLGEDEMDEQERGSLPDELPVIALKNTVLFPNVVLPITGPRKVGESHCRSPGFKQMDWGGSTKG